MELESVIPCDGPETLAKHWESDCRHTLRASRGGAVVFGMVWNQVNGGGEKYLSKIKK